jgi:hydroxypyruvate isomerase
MKNSNRRDALKKMVTGTAVVAAAPFLSSFGCETEAPKELSTRTPMEKLKGNINHSVCQWTYNHLSLDELCIEVKKLGLGAIDLIAPKDWPTLKKHGLYCSMCYTAGKVSLTEGWNNKTFQPQLIKDFTQAIPLVKEAGYKNLICFSGNRNGMDDATGMMNMEEGIKQIIGLAEKNGVILQIEVFNSKVDHKDYMADKSAWAVELCKRIGSPNFKILYDIYHMQINEGDVIRTIQNNYEYFGHYHTAGVPGRHEINESQELYYPAIMEAILKTGYKGYVAQEFIPTGKTSDEKIVALKDAIRRCDV